MESKFDIRSPQIPSNQNPAEGFILGVNRNNSNNSSESTSSSVNVEKDTVTGKKKEKKQQTQIDSELSADHNADDNIIADTDTSENIIEDQEPTETAEELDDVIEDKDSNAFNSAKTATKGNAETPIKKASTKRTAKGNIAVTMSITKDCNDLLDYIAQLKQENKGKTASAMIMQFAIERFGEKEVRSMINKQRVNKNKKIDSKFDF